MKFEIFHGKDSQWYWRARAGNGRMVCQSEGYTQRSGAKRAILNFVESTLIAHRTVRARWGVYWQQRFIVEK